MKNKETPSGFPEYIVKEKSIIPFLEEFEIRNGIQNGTFVDFPEELYLSWKAPLYVGMNMVFEIPETTNVTRSKFSSKVVYDVNKYDDFTLRLTKLSVLTEPKHPDHE